MKQKRLLLPLVLVIGCLIPGGRATAQASYEILHDTLSATGWFGGDNRTGSQRSVGVGQGVLVDTSIILTDFSFYFDSRFDYSMNPDGFGHEVTLVLNIRDSLGAILQTVAILVPATFESGWVTWTDINMNVDEGTLLIFTTYLVGAYDLNQYTSSQGCDQYHLYTQGERYGKDGISDPDMEDWNNWVIHGSWVSMFWLVGTIQTVDVSNPQPSLPQEMMLTQNFPNPFNPQTALEFSLPRQGEVSLRIFDLLGREIETLHEGFLPAGSHRRTWDATAMPSGTYVARLSGHNATVSRKFVLIK